MNEKNLHECDTYGCHTKIIVVDGEKLQRSWRSENERVFPDGWKTHECYINYTYEEHKQVKRKEKVEAHLRVCKNPGTCMDWLHLVPCETVGCRTSVRIIKGKKLQREWREGRFSGFVPHKCYTPPERTELPTKLYISEWKTLSGGTKFGNILKEKRKAERAPDVPATQYEKTGNEGTKLTLVALWETEVNWKDVKEEGE